MLRKIGVLVFILCNIVLGVGAQQKEKPSGWREISVCDMTFLLPKTLKKHSRGGIDSCVAVFSDKHPSVSLDYGLYSGVGRYDNYLDFKEESFQVDGRPGTLATYVDKLNRKNRVARIFVVLVPRSLQNLDETSMNMFVVGSGVKTVETARTIFGSIKFAQEK